MRAQADKRVRQGPAWRRRALGMSFSRRRRAVMAVLAAASLAGLASPRQVQAQAAGHLRVHWRIALPPFLSPVTLMRAFEPLRTHLEAELARPVQFFTVRDFRELAHAARDSDFDALLLPAHLAALAVSDWGGQALSATLAQTEVQLLVRQDATHRVPQDLAGLDVGMLDPMSLVATVALQWLIDEGLWQGPRRVTIRVQPSVNTALLKLERGELAGVFLAASQLRGQIADLPGERRVLASLPDIPGPIFVAGAKVSTADMQALRQALLNFDPDVTGDRTAANTRHIPFDESLQRRLRAFVQAARHQLDVSR